MSLSDRASKAGPLLLLLLGFLAPLSGPAATAVAVLIIVTFVVQGNISAYFRQIITNKIVLAILVFFALHLVGLLWTQDMRSGLHIVNKQWRLLLIPVLMAFVRKDHTQLYLDSFIAGMTITHIISYLDCFHVINFVVMDWISYNPLLAWCIYLLAHTLLFIHLPRWKSCLYGALILSMTVNMFMTRGRAGYLVFFALLILLSFQYFGRNRLRALITSIILLLVIFLLSYNFSSTFQKRIDGAIDEVLSFEMNRVSPDGNDRLTFFLNTLVIIKEHPLLGVGTGDFPNEYEKVNRVRSPKVCNTDDPHNNYLFVMAQFGVLGLAAILAIFFFQIRCGLDTHDNFKHLRLGLPILFMLISLFGCYLLGHFTTLVFAYFTAVLYRDCHAIS